MFLMIVLFFTLQKSDAPKRIVITPNAIQNISDPMEIKAYGVPYRQKVVFEIAGDCDNDGFPNFEKSKTCPGVVYFWKTGGSNGEISQSMDVSRFGLEIGVSYWIRARFEDSKSGPSVIFSIGANPCTIWKTIVQTFFKGKCDPQFVKLFDRRRDPAQWLTADFEVAIYDTKTESETVIPKSREATGVFWMDSGQLLYTIKDDSKGGLYRYSLDSAISKRLWVHDKVYAPAILNDGRTIVVTEKLDTFHLVLLGPGRGEEKINLPVKLDQILAVNGETQQVLGIHYGLKKLEPGFFLIDLNQATVKDQGFDPSLYIAAMRHPRKPLYLKQHMASDLGPSRIEICTEDHKHENKLTDQKSHLIFPSWSPTGRYIAYLKSKPR